MKTLITVSNPELKQIAFSQEAISLLSSFSEIDWIEEGAPFHVEDLIQCIEEYDAIITSWGSPKLTKEVLLMAKKLKFVGHAAGTVVPIVDESIYDRSIVIVNANEALAKATAEGAVALIMAGAWQIKGYQDQLKSGYWPEPTKQLVPGVSGQTIGLIGYGEISREVIRLLQPFEAHILLYSQHISEQAAEQLGVRLCSLEQLLQQSTIITLHNTLTQPTRGMIGQKELEMIREGALIVNTARGPIIEEAALIKLLQKGKHYAVLDVFDEEPLPADHPLLQLDNVLCLPHICGFGGYWRSKLGLKVIEQMHRWVKGEPIEQQITQEKFKRLTLA